MNEFIHQDILLHIEGVSKSFGGIVALQDIHLSIGAGEIVGIVGASNCGKTTLLNAIGGIIRVDRGMIRFQDQDITYQDQHKITGAGIARTFKYPRLFPRLTVHEHLTLHHQQTTIWKRLLTLGYPLTDEIGVLLEQLNLAHVLDDPAERLSATQQHDLELIMALLPAPKLVLLDEPFTGYGDVDRLREFLLAVQKKTGISILMVEHQLEAVRAMCQRVLIMNSGQIVADGKPAEILTDDMILETFYLV